MKDIYFLVHLQKNSAEMKGHPGIQIFLTFQSKGWRGEGGAFQNDKELCLILYWFIPGVFEFAHQLKVFIILWCGGEEKLRTFDSLLHLV